MVMAEAQLPGVGVTAVLPRRSYTPLLGRLLHDRTADKIASVVSQIPHAAATIVPFDVRSRVERMLARERERAATTTVTARARSRGRRRRGRRTRAGQGRRGRGRTPGRADGG